MNATTKKLEAITKSITKIKSKLSEREIRKFQDPILLAFEKHYFLLIIHCRNTFFLMVEDIKIYKFFYPKQISFNETFQNQHKIIF